MRKMEREMRDKENVVAELAMMDRDKEDRIRELEKREAVRNRY